MKEFWFITKRNNYVSRFTTNVFGEESELMDWLEKNQISIISERENSDYFGKKYRELQLSIPCRGKDYNRGKQITTTIENALVSLGCNEANIYSLLNSFNFKEEFISREIEDKEIVVDYIWVCVLPSYTSQFNEHLTINNLLTNHIWGIFGQECRIFKR